MAIVKCPQCNGSGCSYCKNYGYVNVVSDHNDTGNTKKSPLLGSIRKTLSEPDDLIKSIKENK